ncbi:hypothetical protein ACP90_21865 [Labrenzia sp. CP4]|nr:hypothetical protein ACP90_21865 [Labrenzia sp. CP4]
MSRRGDPWKSELEQSGVRCLFLETRAEIRRWFLRIEAAHGGYIQRTETAKKFKMLLESSSAVLEAIDKMREAIIYLSNIQIEDGDKNIDPFTKYIDLYDDFIFDRRFKDIEEYLVNLEYPTRRHIDYYSPKGALSTSEKLPGRKKGTGVNVRRRLLGINAMVLFAFLKNAFPGQDNTAFENFLSDLENLFFADEDTEAPRPSEVPSVNRKDIHRLARDTVQLLKDIELDERMDLIPKEFDDLGRSQEKLRQIFEEQVWNSWDETAPGLWSHPCTDARDTT